MATSPDDLLTPAEVARMFRVGPKTVTRWARSGELACIKTMGGHRRFRRSEVDRLLEQNTHPSVGGRPPRDAA